MMPRHCSCPGSQRQESRAKRASDSACFVLELTTAAAAATAAATAADTDAAATATCTPTAMPAPHSLSFPIIIAGATTAAIVAITIAAHIARCCVVYIQPTGQCNGR